MGMNMAYKRIGLRAGVYILNGISTYLVFKWGYGLIGYVTVCLLMALIEGLTFWWTVRENLSWCRIHWVPWRDILSFIKVSLEFFVNKILSIFDGSVDVIILGYIVSSTAVSFYTTSYYIILVYNAFMHAIFSSITTYITPLARENNVDKLLQYRQQIVFLMFVLSVVIFSCILSFNGSFVLLWTGKDIFVGQFANLLITLLAFLRFLRTIDSSFLCMYMKVNETNKNMLISILVSVLPLVIFTKMWGIEGVLLGSILFNAMLCILYSRSLRKIMNRGLCSYHLITFRLSVTTVMILCISYIVGEQFELTNWCSLILAALAAVGGISAFILGVGLNNIERSRIMELIRKR
jgi:O-antigen/teichoic acid export membrane protein